MSQVLRAALMASVVFSAEAVGLAGPASAQGNPSELARSRDEEVAAAQQRLIGTYEAEIEAVRSLRVAGRCPESESRATVLSGQIDELRFPHNFPYRDESGEYRSYVPADVGGRLEGELRRRLNAVMRIPCPPTETQADSSTVPHLDDLDEIVDDPDAGLAAQGLAPDERPAPSPAPPPPPPGREDRTTLLFQRGDLDAAFRDCDVARFNAARERLLAIYDRFIAEETDDEQIARLSRERADIARRIPPVCNPDETILEDIGFDVVTTVYAGVGEIGVPGTPTGVVLTGPPGTGSETAAVTSADELDVFVIGGGLSFPLGGIRTGIGLEYLGGEAVRRTFDIPPDSHDGVGFAFGRDEGSTGLLLGSYAGVSGESAVDVRQLNLRTYVTPQLLPREAVPLPRDRVYFSYSFFAEYSHRATDYDSRVASSGDLSGFVYDLSQERHQEIREDRLAIGVEGAMRVPLARSIVLDLRATGAVARRWAELESIEVNRCNVCAPALQNVRIAVSDSSDGWALHGSIAADLSFRVSDSISLALSGAFEQRTNVAGVFNPTTGDDVLAGDTTSFVLSDKFARQVAVKVIMSF